MTNQGQIVPIESTLSVIHFHQQVLNQEPYTIKVFSLYKFSIAIFVIIC